MDRKSVSWRRAEEPGLQRSGEEYWRRGGAAIGKTMKRIRENARRGQLKQPSSVTKLILVQ